LLNVAILMGRLCADPELRHTPSNITVAKFTIAADRDYTPKGQDKQIDFVDIVAWRNTADFVCKYFRKGQLVAVQGAIQTRTYTDKDGNKRKAFEIVAESVHFAESKKDNNDQNTGANQNPNITPNNEDFEEIPTDDDLPF